jgi:uncharacterized protein (DUF2267 family)
MTSTPSSASATAAAKMPGAGASRDARRLAAAVLEVLAGARTPGEAATALDVSLPRYYQLENQALRGLVAACEPKPQGRQASPDKEAEELRRENARLRREVGRQQALVRAGQRVVGLAAPPPAPVKAGGKKPRRRRLARALRVAAQLQNQHNDTSAPATVSATVAVQ